MPIKPKLEKRWGVPHKIVENTPGITTSEASFLKSEGEMIETSNIRTELSTSHDIEKHKAFIERHKGKIILKAHTHGPGTRQLPSAGDVASNFFEFVYDHLSEPKNTLFKDITQEDLRFTKPKVIFVIDKDGKDIGRVHFHLTPKTVNFLKNGFTRFTVESREAMKNSINSEIYKLTVGEILRHQKAIGKPLSDNSKYIVNLHATKYYFEQVLGLHMHFNPMPGYQFNKEKLEFEKINKE